MSDVLPQPQPSPQEQQFRHALAMIRQSLAELQGGELFCMDRGYPWTLESEGHRRQSIADWFTDLPSLRERLPTMWTLLRSDQTIGDKSGLIEEIDAAIQSVG